MAERWDNGDTYDAYVGRWSRLLAPKFVDWAHLPANASVVDVGCGTGAVSAALLHAGAARVVGVDNSPAYVERAAATVGVGTGKVTFEVGDAMGLPLDDDAYDGAVSGLCLPFVPEPDAMVAEMARVVKPGGHVALYVWDYGDKMEMLRYFWDAAVQLDPDRAGPLDEGVKFPICHAAPLEELFKAHGLIEVATSHIDQPTVFKNFDDYWEPFLAGQGPAPNYVAALTDIGKTRLRDTLRRRLPLRIDGMIHLNARAWAVRGSKPKEKPTRKAKVGRKGSPSRGRARH